MSHYPEIKIFEIMMLKKFYFMIARLLYGGIANSSIGGMKTWRVFRQSPIRSGGVFGCGDDHPMPDICSLQNDKTMTSLHSCGEITSAVAHYKTRS